MAGVGGTPQEELSGWCQLIDPAWLLRPTPAGGVRGELNAACGSGIMTCRPQCPSGPAWSAVDALQRFCCQNSDCPRYGQRGLGNLSVCGRYGRDDLYRLLYCNVCKYRFSERKATPLFDCRLPRDKVLGVLKHLADGCGVRQTARLVGVCKDTVVRLAKVAGEHAQQLHDELVGFSPLHPASPTGREVVLRRQEAEAH